MNKGSHSLHWECGLKRSILYLRVGLEGHSLHWECGLKRYIDSDTSRRISSLPSLGVWIETA